MSTEKVRSTTKQPLWFNPRKYPCNVPHPKGSVTVPPGHYVIGRCFAQCAQPPYGTSNRSIIFAGEGFEAPRNKVLDPLGLLRLPADRAEEKIAETSRGALEIYEGRTEESWRTYFGKASDEQIIGDYQDAKKLKKIAKFLGVPVKKEATIEDVVAQLKAWAS